MGWPSSSLQVEAHLAHQQQLVVWPACLRGTYKSTSPLLHSQAGARAPLLFPSTSSPVAPREVSLQFARLRFYNFTTKRSSPLVRFPSSFILLPPGTISIQLVWPSARRHLRPALEPLNSTRLAELSLLAVITVPAAWKPLAASNITWD